MERVKGKPRYKAYKYTYILNSIYSKLNWKKGLSPKDIRSQILSVSNKMEW